jgi:hypothetical protein
MAIELSDYIHLMIGTFFLLFGFFGMIKESKQNYLNFVDIGAIGYDQEDDKTDICELKEREIPLYLIKDLRN